MAALTLTDRQRTELNHAILDYLVSQGDKFSETISKFREEAEIGNEAELGKGLLERKWTSVIRLQKRVMELETQLQNHKSANGHALPEPGSGQINPDSRLLPRPPARTTLTGHRSPVTVVVTHPVYSLLASGSEDTTIRIWDTETNQYERTLKGHTGAITGLAFDSKGFLLASCSIDMSAKIWDMNNYSCTKTIKGHDHTISSIQFFANNDQLITCSRDHTIKFWEVATGYCLKTFSDHTDWVKTISTSLDGQYLASAGNEQSIFIWQISSGTVIQVSCRRIIELLHDLLIPSYIDFKRSRTRRGNSLLWQKAIRCISSDSKIKLRR